MAARTDPDSPHPPVSSLASGQVLSHYPAIPAPARVSLRVMEPHDCAYLAGRVATTRGIWVSADDGEGYQRFMDAGFRRSGNIVYQPVCAGCRACTSLRIDAESFHLTPSQRRIMRRNADLTVGIAAPELTGERVDLYRRYLAGQHPSKADNREVTTGDTNGETTEEDLRSFLYTSPVPTAEMTYRDPAGKLVAVGIVDITPGAISSVYFYWDPAERRRSLGTFSALRELALTRDSGRRWYHLGYWVAGSPAMDYKARLGDHEILGTDGQWRHAPRRK